jgi:hypothetical protein
MTATADYLNMTLDEYWHSTSDYILADDHVTDAKVALEHVLTLSEFLDLLRHHGNRREADVIMEDVKHLKDSAAERERLDAQYN